MRDSSDVRIKLDSLPPRSRPLDSHELGKVFGGCSPNGDSCFKDSDCCSQFCVNDLVGGVCRTEYKP